MSQEQAPGKDEAPSSKHQPPLSCRIRSWLFYSPSLVLITGCGKGLRANTESQRCRSCKEKINIFACVEPKDLAPNETWDAFEKAVEGMGREAAKALSAMKENNTMNGWISVKAKKKPDDYEEVIVFDRNVGKTAAVYSKSDGTWRTDFDGIVLEDVTHWMPMPPDPPKEE